MTFNQLLKSYTKSFPWNSTFELRKGEKLSKRLIEEGVPEEPGVYLIYAKKKRTKPKLLCIGKAGTMLRNGNFQKQKLPGRLKAKQNGKTRQKFFQEQIQKPEIDALMFHWFVTFHHNIRVIPAKAEADLLQTYYNKHKQLPEWNKTF